MASETTAAATGAVGVIRRDPMAMRPFLGYHVGDYFAHWLEMGRTLGENAPKIFHVNWFRRDKTTNQFLWPGYGENLRAVIWALDRCEGKAKAQETAMGHLPVPESLNLAGLELTTDKINALLSVDPADWTEDVADQRAFFDKVGDRLPAVLRQEQDAFIKRLGL